MQTVPAVSILSARREGGWFGSEYNVNLYRGCCHGCVYCDSRSECYRIESFDTVRVKENALPILERELRSKRNAGMVLTGSMSDPYNPFEREEQVTRGALALYERYGFGAGIVTKSPLAARDADLLASVAKHAPVCVAYTVTCADDALCRKLERSVAVSSERLDALARLSEQGVTCGVMLTPVMPFISDTEENILGVVRLAKQAGARWVYSGGGFGVTLRQNQRLYCLERLEETFPGMKRRYIARYADAYVCAVPDERELYAAFTAECERLGLMWRMRDITAAVQRPYDLAARQQSFFLPDEG